MTADADDLPDGLTDAEADARRGRGEGNDVVIGAGRSYLAIVRANLFTFFNNILFAIGIALIALGRINDAVTSVGLGFIIAIIGTVQEFRSRRQLERIAVLNTPTVRLVRGGVERDAAPATIVRGDLIRVRPGDQIVADGPLVSGSNVELDESLLTGESTSIHRVAGEAVRSGSICLSGSGAYVAEKVGRASYANEIAAKVKRLKLARTALQRQIDTMVRLVMLVVAVMSAILLAAALLDDVTTLRLVQLAAVLSGQVPYGLFFVVVLAYAISAAALARQGALVQQIDAVESLSDTDILCLDKTGTLTTNHLTFREVRPLGSTSADDVRRILGVFAASASAPNQTLLAIAGALNQPACTPAGSIAFSSARKWSALAFDRPDVAGVYALGAFEMLAEHLADAPHDLRDKVHELAASGVRVLLFAGGDGVIAAGDVSLPPLRALALVVLGEDMRPNVRETLDHFAALGISVKIISGDDPETVAAIAREAGMTGSLERVSGPDLGRLDDAAFASAASRATIFGRITPDQKERIVEGLMATGAHVAMIGDGVNDILALKRAQLGIAMKSGSAAARNTADMVLLGDDFGPLIAAFAEGRRVKAGMGQSMFLFMARVAASILAIIAITMLGLPFPIEPSQVGLTLLTVGIPTTLLVLWARPADAESGLVRRIVRFVSPVALATMLVGTILYVVVYYWTPELVETPWFTARFTTSIERLTGIARGEAGFGMAAAQAFAQSILSTFLTLSAFVLILFVVPPSRALLGFVDRVSADRRPLWLALGLALSFILVAWIAPLAEYFGLVPATIEIYALMALLVPAWAAVLVMAWRNRWLARFLRID